jgi:hypothetical protein
MARPESFSQLELEHIIRYGTWEENAAHDPLEDEEDDDDAEGSTDEEESDDEEVVPLSLSDLEILDPEQDMH